MACKIHVLAGIGAIAMPLPSVKLREQAIKRAAAEAERKAAEELARVQRELDRWRKGVPLRGAIVPTSANLAVRGTPTVVDSRGWVSSYGDGFIP